MRGKVLAWTGLLGLCLLLAGGCGPRRPLTTPLRGTVTYQGQPVTAGIVVLESADGKQTETGALDGTGGFSIPEAPVGEVRIAIRTEIFRSFRGPEGAGTASTAGVPGPYRTIPTKYERIDTSGLVRTIQEGQGTLDLVLE